MMKAEPNQLEAYIQRMSLKENAKRYRKQFRIVGALSLLLLAVSAYRMADLRQGASAGAHASAALNVSPASQPDVPQLVLLEGPIALRDLAIYFEQPNAIIVLHDSTGTRRDTFQRLEEVLLSDGDWILPEPVKEDWAGILDRTGISLVGQAVAGQSFVLVIKGFDARIRYTGQLGQGTARQLGLTQELTLPQAGTYHWHMTATAPDGSTRQYVRSIVLEEPAYLLPEPAQEESFSGGTD